MASILAAATLVERAGILTIDKAKLTAWLVEQLANQKSGVSDNYKSPTDASVGSVFSFIDQHRSKMLLVETFNGVGGMSKYGNILTPQNQQPRDEIVILKAVADKKLRIQYHAWKQYVTTVLKHSPTTLETELAKLGACKIKANLSAGIQAASNARVLCLEVDLTAAAFVPLLDD